MVVMNFESVGMGLMETGMAWFWPVRRIARWTDTIGFEHIRDVQAQQRGILLIGIHFLTLEMGARMFRVWNEPGIGVYRPNDNPVIDWLQTWGRLRSNKDMIDRGDLKGMIRALKRRSGVVRTGITITARPPARLRPTVCGRRPGGDHLRHLDAGEDVPKPASCRFVPRRKPDGEGYELIILPPECFPAAGRRGNHRRVDEQDR